ncbi:MAG: hypothetical protein K2W95_32135 [Candidatus Obscuribacterales bacterium]|nr:hypothetical protein [Candidatus Obscuribacterales bacterium]
MCGSLEAPGAGWKPAPGRWFCGPEDRPVLHGPVGDATGRGTTYAGVSRVNGQALVRIASALGSFGWKNQSLYETGVFLHDDDFV